MSRLDRRTFATLAATLAISPQAQATSIQMPFEEWRCEFTYAGYTLRLRVYVDGLVLVSVNGVDWTRNISTDEQDNLHTFSGPHGSSAQFEISEDGIPRIEWLSIKEPCV